MVGTVLSIFRLHWRTFFFWTLGLTLVHLFGAYLSFENLGITVFKDKNWGDSGFVASVARIYSAIYAFGVPMVINLFMNKLKEYKNILPREFIMFHPEVIFFVTVTPIFIAYTMVIHYFNLVNDIHGLVLCLLILYSLFRLYRLADLCLAVVRDFRGLLGDKFQNRTNEIFEEI